MLSLTLSQPSAPPGRPSDEAFFIRTAQSLAVQFREGASARDRDRRLPEAEFRQMAEAGLLSVLVPTAFGGPGLSFAAAARIVSTIAAADSSIAQLFVSTFVAIRYIDDVGSREQKERLFRRILDGVRFGNASSEAGGASAHAMATRAVRDNDTYVITGRKFYSTSALLADLISVVARDENDEMVTLVADRHAPGLTIIDDWDGFGQRTTASGTVVLERVPVPAEDVFHVRRRPSGMQHPFTVPSLIHAAIDVGIAGEALDATIRHLRTKARPYRTAQADTASRDPLIVQGMGLLLARFHAAEASRDRAGLAADEALRAPSRERADEAAIAVSEARILATEIALEASTRLFQYGGASSTRASLGLDRLWRDARTHTVHDPVHWHAHAVGNYAVNGEGPPG